MTFILGTFILILNQRRSQGAGSQAPLLDRQMDQNWQKLPDVTVTFYQKLRQYGQKTHKIT